MAGNLPHQWVRSFVVVSSEPINAEGRGSVTLRLLPPDPNVSFLHGLALRMFEVTAYAAYLFSHILQTRPGNWVLTVEIRLQDNSVLLTNPATRRTKYGLNRRFTTPYQIAEHMPLSWSSAMANMTQSERSFTLDDMEIVLRYVRVADVVRGRLPKYIRTVIQSGEKVKGLYKYSPIDGMCGYQAIVYALSTNFDLWKYWNHEDLTWYTKFFDTTGPRPTEQLGSSKRRFLRVCEALREHLNGPREWVVSLEADKSTAAHVVGLNPKLQIVIFNEVTRMIHEKRRGIEYDPEEAPNNTICLSYTLGHVQLIKGLFAYFGKTWRAGSIYCFDCLKFFMNARHKCKASGMQCPKCFLPFKTQHQLDSHCTGRQVGCGACAKTFYGNSCLKLHSCLRNKLPLCTICTQPQGTDHVCNAYRCASCDKKVLPGHRCYIETLEAKEEIDVQDCCKDYYVFDIESMFLEKSDGSNQHEANLIVVKKVFGRDELVFSTMKQFVDWVEARQVKTELFAHNLMGYDGRMVFDHLFRNHVPPQRMIWKGAKILYMEYGKATFRDTLPHLTASLEALPAMFGLNTDEFAKGFFPYKFNLPENQGYVGRKPAVEYYDPDRMPTEKRNKFLEWYAEQEEDGYDFDAEILKYCLSDVRILSKAIEAYVTTMTDLKPINPLDSKTIAGYAIKMYRTHFMPENEICRLKPEEHRLINKAMHGGRTDVRRLLREWTNEELERGVYGCYVDVQSLYPTVQFYDPLPVGIPRFRKIKDDEEVTDDDLLQVFGFVCCDIHPTEYLHHPIIVELKDGKLMADLEPKRMIVVPTPELHLALKHGYKVTKVYWWYDFDSSTSLFKDYIRTFLKMKIEASGMPRGIEFEEYARKHQQELGITLERDKMIKNSALKTGVKLLLNSLWGKFGERNKTTQWQRFDLNEQKPEIYNVENRWIDGEIDILFRKQTEDGLALGMLYQHSDTIDQDSMYQKIHRPHANIGVGAMIPSWARCRLWTELHKLGDRVLYHDTDSIIYEHQPDGYNVKEGAYLGDWEDELSGVKMQRFVATGPKSYAYILEDGKEACKVKGFTLSHATAQKINFEAMKRLVLGEEETIITDSLLFKHDRVMGEMITKNVKKAFRVTVNKGHIDPVTWKVYPFGYEKFRG